MNQDITLDTTVLMGKSAKIKQFLSDRNLDKFLKSIETDGQFRFEEGILYFQGEKDVRRMRREKKWDRAEGIPTYHGPQQVKAFHQLSSSPLFRNYQGHPVQLQDIYRGATAFLILSGPSTDDLDISLLEKPGILKMGVNNSPKIVRPNLWTCVDPPDRFLKSIFYDPTIMKFVPESFRKKVMWDSTRDKLVSDRAVGDCPTVFYYHRNSVLVVDTWLTEDTMNWGNQSGMVIEDPITLRRASGGRSCMFPAVKTLILMGVRTIFLVGADFYMDEKKPYGFEQGKDADASAGNNLTYQTLNVYFNVLRPKFEEVGVQIFNTNPKSGLKSFDFVDYEEAVNFALSEIGDTDVEPTAGMYDGLKSKKKRIKPIKERKRIINQGHYVPDLEYLNKFNDDPMYEMVVTETGVKPPKVDEKIITVEEMWDRRNVITDGYPALREFQNKTERRLEMLEGESYKKDRLKIIRKFYDGVVRHIMNNPECLEQLEIFEEDRKLYNNGSSIILRDVYFRAGCIE